MKVALFRPSLWSKPTGIVWWDGVDGTARFDFVNDGDETLARDELVGATSQIQFESKVDRLAARTPMSVAWETADIDMAPQEYVSLMQRAKFSA